MDKDVAKGNLELDKVQFFCFDFDKGSSEFVLKDNFIVIEKEKVYAVGQLYKSNINSSEIEVQEINQMMTNR